MTYGQLFMTLNPNVKVVENGTCVWIYFESVNHDTLRVEWWNKEIPDELLKAQEPRVMQITEVMDAEVAWLEKYGENEIKPVIILCYEYGYWKCLIYNENDAEITLTIDGFNTDWRCWTSRPTDEQRKAVKWE